MSKKKTRKTHLKVSVLAEGEGRRKTGPVMGVDVHKSVLAYCIVSEVALLAEGELSNDKQGINKLHGIIKRKQVRGVAMESTAQYHFKILYALLEKNVKVLVANPQQTKSTQGKKTDKLDARRIAIAYRDGRLKPSVISPREIMTLRKGMRGLTRKVEEQTKSKQRLQQVFHQKDVALGKLLGTKWGCEVLLRLFEDDVDALLGKHLITRRKAKRASYKKDLVAFKRSMDEIEQQVFRIEMEQLIALGYQADRLRLVYYQLCRQNKEFKKLMRLLLSIPGIGPDTAAKVIAEIVDVSYFPSAKKLVKWAGLAPRVYQSGHRKNVTGHIHKGGNKYLRRAVVLACANIYARGSKDNPLHQFARLKQQEKDAYWLVLCATARKLLVSMWHMWSNSESWSPRDSSETLETAVNKIVASKLAMLERHVRRYEKVKEKLSRESTEAMYRMQARATPPRKLVLALLESV
ncbi:MAG: IS110 family transposase [Candidatus Hodarchaeota archaeon]